MSTDPTPEPLPASEPASPTRAPGDDARASHLRVAPDPVNRRRTRLAVWGATAVTVASLFALVSFHAMAVQQAFELDRLADQQTREARRYERLRAEVAERSSPEAIVDAARAMGMVVPSEPVTQIEAAPAAPTVAADEQTSDTLTEAHEAKPSLGP